jgi:D-3-phosphoglycerate dehydrogenase
MKRKIRIDCPTDWASFAQYAIEAKLDELNFVRTYDNDAEFIILNPATKSYLSAQYFSQFKLLKAVATPSTGINHVDVEYLKSNKIVFYSLLDNRARMIDEITASSEFTWLHIMAAWRKFLPAVNNFQSWREHENEMLLRSHQLKNKSLGIIGLGRIGTNIARYAQAFGMHVFALDIRDCALDNVTCVKTLNDMKHVDILSINCGLNETSKNLICRGSLDEFKNGLLIVNTARGEIVDEQYIIDLLRTRKMNYSCDVVHHEFDDITKSTIYNHALMSQNSSLTVTPHVAGATVDSQLAAFDIALSLLSKLCL